MEKRLEITTMVGCPLKCTYCPQDLLRSEYDDRNNTKYMDATSYRTMLAKVPLDVRIDFSGMAEPFANPDAIEMLDGTLARGYRIALYTTLYGLTGEHADHVARMLEIYASQVATVCLHLPDLKGNMTGFRYSFEYERTLSLFLALGEKGKVKVECMTMGDVVSSRLVAQSLALMRFKPISRADNVEREKVRGKAPRKVYHHGPITCHKYYQNVLMPNGDVYLCCMDYGMKHRLGNLMQHDYADILRAADEIASRNVRVEGEPTICRSCEKARPA